MKNEAPRPQLSEYDDMVNYLTDMLQFRKKTERGFSVSGQCRRLRRVSPALISLIKQRKRRITLDRVNELAKLMNLTTDEKKFFLHRVEWLCRNEEDSMEPFENEAPPQHRRREVNTGILNDWINVYVKDLFQIPEIQKNPQKVFNTLASVASPKRVEKSIQFLIKEGHLKKTLNGEIVIDENLSVADPRVPSEKIRKFHKGALQYARQAIDTVAPERRMANCLIVPLNSEAYDEMMQLVDEFTENLKRFAERDAEPGDQLHQLVLNISPIGGSE